MSRELGDDLRTLRRRVMLFGCPPAAMASLAGIAADVEPSLLGIVLRIGAAATFLVLVVGLLTDRVDLERSLRVAWSAFATMGVADVASLLEAGSRLGGTAVVLAAVAYQSVLLPAAYMVWRRAPARRAAGAVLIVTYAALAVAASRSLLMATDVYALFVPLLTALVVEVMAGTVVVLDRHQAEASAEAAEGRRDQLTQLLNRRGMLPHLEAMTLGDVLVLGDVDRFKAVNDRHGHDVGDHVLRQVAATLRDVSRSRDVAGRWGGEEFVLLVPMADPADVDGAADNARVARDLAERIRDAVERSSTVVPVTISLGVAALGPGDHDWQDVLRRADGQLYDAKRSGRNRVHASTDAAA